MSGFSKTYRVDRNNKRGDILRYIREKIISKSIASSFNKNNLEYLPGKINLGKKERLLVCSYIPQKRVSKDFYTAICKEINSHSSRHENLSDNFIAKLTKNQCSTFVKFMALKIFYLTLHVAKTLKILHVLI